MTWGVESDVTERFTAAGIPADDISFQRDTYRFEIVIPPAEVVGEFRSYYGPTMNAFDAADSKGRTDELEAELVALFEAQNESTEDGDDVIPATFLRVTVAV